MSFFQDIFYAIRNFFIKLSCRTKPTYKSLNSNDYDDCEEVHKIYNNVIS